MPANSSTAKAVIVRGSSRRRKNPTRRHRREAIERSAALGPLHEVPPAETNEFSEPRLGQDQVFVTRTGEVFHTGWCQRVQDVAEQDLARLVVIEQDTVGRRRLCVTCRDEGHLR